jgi:hypothetical protein
MDSSSALRVSQLVGFAKSGTLDYFVSKYPNPALVIMGSGTSSSDEFMTQRVDFVNIFEYVKKRGVLDPTSRVYFLEKTPGRNSFSKMIIVGRVPKCDILLESPAISKMHAYFTWTETPEGKTYHLVDGNSSNGTWINKTQLLPNQPTDIQDGDVVGLSGTIFMRFFSPESLFSSLSKLIAE